MKINWLAIKQNPLIETIRVFLPSWVNKYFYHLPKAVLANVVYRFPGRRIKIIGVTGTDGKTTTSTIIHHILTKSGYRAALVSSVEAKYGLKTIPTGLHVTSPSPFFLQKLIRELVSKSYSYLVLETTSHGIDQFRTWGFNYQIGVLTNITKEHLDYHKTYQKYFSAKLKMLKQSRIAVLNIDDNSYLPVLNKIQKQTDIKTYGLTKGDYNLLNTPVKTKLAGEYNMYNCLAAAAVCAVLGVSKKQILQGAASFKGIVGRMEFIANNQGLNIYVDFAHTPNALKNVLETLKQKHQKGKLIAVFGCAGLRDRQKRPEMGKISADLADFIIVTAEDPRTENISKINLSIEQGLRQNKNIIKIKDVGFKSQDLQKDKKYYFVIPDRQKAIDFAVQKLAKKGDTVGIFGKGHEQSLCYGVSEYPWSDYRAVKRALKGKK